MVPEELGETGPIPSPEAQVKNHERFLEAMRNHYRILEQKRGISSRKCLSCPAENTDFAARASQMPLIFFLHCGLWNICVSPPSTARHFAAAPTHHHQSPRPPWLEVFHHSAQTLGLQGLWKHSQNVHSVQWRHLLGKSRLQAFLSPRRLHPNVLLQDSASQKGYPQLTRQASTLESPGCLHSGQSRPVSAHVLPPSYLSDFPVCVNISTIVLTHDELVNRLIVSALID